MASTWTYKDFVKDALSRVPEVSPVDAQQRPLPRAVFLDCREGDELMGGVIPGSVVLPRGLIEKHVHEHVPDKNTPVYVYCATGNRSALVADTLLKMGYGHVFSLKGGIEGWQHEGLPLTGHAAVCAIPNQRLTWAQVRAEFPIVERRVPVLGSGERPLVYLDHAASTHAPTSVLEAYREFMQREYSNVHRGTHLLSRKATERFEEAYYVVADFIGAELKNGCIAFTQNTTQAIDLASHAMAHRPGKVVISEMEHHSNDLPHRTRSTLLRARVNEAGDIDLNHLEELLRKHDVKLVAVSAGSNVTGIMPPIHAIARLAHEHGALILVDAAQALARMKLDVKPFSDPEHLDFLAGAGHKAYAPFGAGFLYGPRAVLDEAPPYLAGGGTAANVTTQAVEYLKAPDRHTGGTPNIGGVVAMSRALLFIDAIGRDEIRAHERALTHQMLRGLESVGGVTIYGPTDAAQRLGVVTFNVQGVSELLTAAVLSEEGAIAVRNGRFCAHPYVDKLLAAHHGDVARHSLDAGVAPTGMVRASVGLYNDETDVARLVEYVGRVRDRKWVGRYRTTGDGMSAAFAGRCADKWMEASPDADPLLEPEIGSPPGYLFEVLQPDSASRTYLIADPETGEAALVDPLRERVDEYLKLLSEKRLRLRYTIETHTHADHVSGSARLKELTQAKMVMHQSSQAVCVDAPVNDGDVLALGRLKLEVLYTPGHTADAICLLLPDRVLTGDTLLIGSVGRTDLPTGQAAALFDSLQRLLALPDHILVLPGHDYDGRRVSTIGRERKGNGRLKIASREEFLSAMARMSLPEPTGMRDVLATNQQCRS